MDNEYLIKSVQELKELNLKLLEKVNDLEHKAQKNNEIADKLSNYIWVLDFIGNVCKKMNPRNILYSQLSIE